MVEHDRLKRLYAAAVDLLFATGYKVTEPEYAKLKNSTEEARVQVEIARLELERHRLAVHSKAG